MDQLLNVLSSAAEWRGGNKGEEASERQLCCLPAEAELVLPGRSVHAFTLN